MCGFVGFFSKTDFFALSQDIVEANGELGHRGPDATGTYFDQEGGVGLAHRRLSIIDLSDAGAQPMQSSDGQTVIAYNGEVYNFKDLRKQLQECGYHFVSQTDTEVVLYAFKEWGTDCFNHFVGMFAIAIWDRPTNRLIICRDRIGIKPLYYYYDGRIFLFSSELKALMAFKRYPKRIDEEAIPLFLHYQYIPAPKTIFTYTHKLCPGTYLEYNGLELSVKRYWGSVDPLPNLPADLDKEEEGKIDELDHLITRAVSDRLVSDVPLGALLSGGIDSSLVVALMQKVHPTPVRTFTIGFDEQHYNEAPWARKVAEHLNTDHTELYVSPVEALNTIEKLPDIYNEPFADASAIPTFLVSKLTRSHVTVALSGDGGDEQFMGYARYWMTRAMRDGLGCLPKLVKRQLANVLNKLPTHWIAWCYALCRDSLPHRLRVENFPDKWQKLILQLKQERVSELYRMSICVWPNNELNDLIGYPLPESHYESLFNATSGRPTLSRLMTVDQNTYLPDCLLTKVDRASMAASLEVRVPLLDHRVVEFTHRLPVSLKYRNGNGKYLLKEVLARYVPRNLYERPKMGFGVPIDHWFRKELKELLLDYLSPTSLNAEGRFNAVLIEKKIKEHLSGRVNHHHRLWAILMWQMWRERWL